LTVLIYNFTIVELVNLLIFSLKGCLPVSLVSSALKKLDNALNKLEAAVDTRIEMDAQVQVEPQFDLTVRNEKDVNRKVALKLDKTIEHLEKLLSGGNK